MYKKIKAFCLALVLVASLKAMEEQKDALKKYFDGQGIVDLLALKQEISEKRDASLQEFKFIPRFTPLELTKQSELDQLNFFYNEINNYIFKLTAKKNSQKRKLAQSNQQKNKTSKIKKRKINGSYGRYSDKFETFEIMKTQFNLKKIHKDSINCPFPLCSSKDPMASTGTLLWHLPRFHFKEFLDFDLSYRAFIDYLCDTEDA